VEKESTTTTSSATVSTDSMHRVMFRSSLNVMMTAESAGMALSGFYKESVEWRLRTNVMV
jgi:hypothetical protein